MRTCWGCGKCREFVYPTSFCRSCWDAKQQEAGDDMARRVEAIRREYWEKMNKP